MKQRERTQVQAMKLGAYGKDEDDNANSDDDDGSAMDNDNNEQEKNVSSSHERNGNSIVHATAYENTAGSTTHWIVGSGLTQPEDFAFLYQTVIEHETDNQADTNKDSE